MKRTDNKAKKLAVLELIKEQKALLFGSFQNNKVSKLEKEMAWEEVLKKAQSLGLASLKRTWTYARDHIFGQWKCRTLAKRDNAKKTGTGGGKDFIMDEVDEIILDIIGSESAMVDGLDLPEADGIHSFSELPPPTAVQQTLSVPERRIRKRKKDNEADSLISLKKQVLESELHKNKLQILKLENELKLPKSKFTCQFLKPNCIIELDNDNSNDSGFSKNKNDDNEISTYIEDILAEK